MNWAAGICRHWRAKNAFSRSRFAAWRGAKTASGHSRHTHGRAGHGLPFGPCSPASGSAQAAVNTSRCPPASSASAASSSPSRAASCGKSRGQPGGLGVGEHRRRVSPAQHVALGISR